MVAIPRSGRQAGSKVNSQCTSTYKASSSDLAARKARRECRERPWAIKPVQPATEATVPVDHAAATASIVTSGSEGTEGAAIERDACIVTCSPSVLASDELQADLTPASSEGMDLSSVGIVGIEESSDLTDDSWGEFDLSTTQVDSGSGGSRTVAPSPSQSLEVDDVWKMMKGKDLSIHEILGLIGQMDGPTDSKPRQQGEGSDNGPLLASVCLRSALKGARGRMDPKPKKVTFQAKHTVGYDTVHHVESVKAEVAANQWPSKNERINKRLRDEEFGRGIDHQNTVCSALLCNTCPYPSLVSSTYPCSCLCFNTYSWPSPVFDTGPCSPHYAACC